MHVVSQLMYMYMFMLCNIVFSLTFEGDNVGISIITSSVML